MAPPNIYTTADLLTCSAGTDAPQRCKPSDARNLDISLPDFLEQVPIVSARLSNGIRFAESEGMLPFPSVAAYLTAGPEAAHRMRAIPNLGKKSIEELGRLIDNWTPEAVAAQPMLEVPRDFEISLQEFLQKQFKVSARLKNAIEAMTREGNCPFDTVAEYIHAQVGGYSRLCRIPSLGTASASEFDKLVRDSLKPGSLDPLQTGRVVTDGGFPDLEQVLDGAFALLTSRERDVLLDRVQSSLTLQEIADNFKRTRQAMQRIEGIAIKRLTQGYDHVLEDSLLAIHAQLVKDGIAECSLAELARHMSCDITALELFFALLQKLELAQSALITRLGSYVMLPAAFLPSEQWSRAVRRALLAATWPLDLASLLQALPLVPQCYVITHLCQEYGAAVIGERMFSPPRLSVSDMCICVLGAAQGPLHISEIKAALFKLFAHDISDQHVTATVSRLKEAAIVGLGSYTLYSYLPYSPENLCLIRDAVYVYLGSRNTFLSSKFIFESLFANGGEPCGGLNHYVMMGILKDDPRFVTKRGNMIGLSTFDVNDSFVLLEDEVRDLVRSHGPISVAEIMTRLSDTRRLSNDSGVRQILAKSPDIIKINARLYDALDRFFRSQSDYDDFVLAIKVNLLAGQKSSYVLTGEVARLGFERVSSEVLDSLLNGVDEIERGANGYRLATASEELSCYREIAESCIARGDGRATLLYCLLGTAAEAHAEQLVRYDLRFFAGTTSVINTTPPSESELGAILTEFQF